MRIYTGLGLSLLLVFWTVPMAEDRERDADPWKVEQNETDSQLKGNSNESRVRSSSQAVAIGEEIHWQVLSGGGGRGTSTNFILVSSIGQTAVGPGSSPSYHLNSGFLQNFGSGGCCVGSTGDINGDSVEGDPVDLAYLVDYLFNGGPAAPCPEEADVNGDGISGDPVDLAYLVDYLFAGGPAPEACS